MANTVTTHTMDFGAPEPQKHGGFFLIFAWRGKWLILLATIVGLGLGYLYVCQIEVIPVYESTAQILIFKRQTEKLPLQGLPVNTAYDTIHETILRSPAVAELAAKKTGIDVQAIMAGLTVTSQGKDKTAGQILELRFTSGNREECDKVLAAVISAHEEFLGSTYQDVSKQAIDLIVEAKDQLDKQLTETETNYRKFRNEAPLLFTGGTGQNLHEARLQQIEAVRSQAVLENSKLQARIQGIDAALKRGGSREALNLMVGQLDAGADRTATSPAVPAISTIKESGGSTEEQLFTVMLEEQLLLEQYGADHPKVQTARKRASLLRQHLLGTATAETEKPEKPRDFFEVYVESLKELIDLNKETITEMDALFQKERDSSKALASFQVTDETFRSSIERKERLFNTIVTRLEEISLVTEPGGFRVQVIHPPSGAYAIKVQNDQNKMLITTALMGLMAGLGLAYVIDLADRRFRSPDEIREELGTPVVGHIPMITDGPSKAEAGSAAAALSPVLTTFHHPQGRAAEAYRAVRTALYFNTSGRGNQVIQVSSPSPGDGKTTLAANLATSIAHSGKRVLLIDCDFRRPRVHRLFGLSNSTGTTSVLAGTTELADAVQSTLVENLSILTCGPRPDNPSELASSKQFEKLVGVLREKYDLVIVDTPPVLAVTDPLNVVPRVDGILLVLRLSKSARSGAKRALESLAALGANVLGIVVNGVGGQQGYGMYGKYGGYGGYGAYGYRYEYGSRKGEHDSYYADDEEDAEEAVGIGAIASPNGSVPGSNGALHE